MGLDLFNMRNKSVKNNLGSQFVSLNRIPF